MSAAESVAAFTFMAYLVLVALLVGSFINLATDRLPRHESIVRPRSHCRSCGRVLNLVDLIPIAGYAIGAASPAVEALCGASMVASLVLLGPLRGALAGAAAVSLVGMATVGLAVARAGGPKRV